MTTLFNLSSPLEILLFRHFEAIEARFLRASFSAFVDVLTLATKTIEEFGPGVEL
jgi:EKC/KEOPS complex subunit PCC1/LAGE3